MCPQSAILSHAIWPEKVTKVCFIAHCQNSRILRTHKATRDINQANSHEETSDNLQDANSQLNVTLHCLGDLNHSFLLSLIHIFLVVVRRAQCLSFWLVALRCLCFPRPKESKKLFGSSRFQNSCVRGPSEQERTLLARTTF